MELEVGTVRMLRHATTMGTALLMVAVVNKTGWVLEALPAFIANSDLMVMLTTRCCHDGVRCN
ncbi:MAG: hypothetical protein GY696_03135 [Gammaproteobacteria bacterium]|nr:hypothetical protein [Gammaproteobacteria bacterium]